MNIDYEKLGAFYLGREVDPATGKAADAPLLYDSRDLTTHAVCVGMTGSGKTGLCLALLEEAAIDGVPALCIDPKGDLGNLLLNFPTLSPSDFADWVDPAEALRKGLSVADYAAQTANQWKTGLADWGQEPARIARLRDAVDMAIYTPGADSGLPLSMLQSFRAPPDAVASDAAALAERVAAVASGLLTLLGRDVDPLRSREHILISNLLDKAWREGRDMDLAQLIGAIQKPSIDKLGALDLETFYPSKERLELALALNAVLASPGFAAWTRGEPLDAQRLLFTPEGKPRIVVLSIAHLSDSERMFVVTLVLNEMIQWMRRQPGTSSLRAILYMDEIAGYFPPTANPPSKPPMLTLLKQARAFGLGCVLATQNPVDLDYKGLGNTGTWLIGRLQTERDRDRLLDGLTSALAGSTDRAALDRMLASLTPRVFLMRNVHDEHPVLLKSRWTLSYLRGPLAPAEISRLMQGRRQGTTTQSLSGASTAIDDVSVSAPAANAPRPALPAGIEEYFQLVRGGSQGLTYKPAILALAKTHYVDAKLGLDQWQTLSLIAPLSDDGKDVLWDEARRSTLALSALDAGPAAGAGFTELPAPAGRAASYGAWTKSLAAQLYETDRATLLVCDALKASSQAGESEGDFRARLSQQLREQRDTQVAALRARYAPKLQSAQQALVRAQERAQREQAQLSQQKLQTAISVGATLLGAFFGRKAVSATSLGRATTAIRNAGRIGSEAADVERAGESLEQAQQRIADLTRECDEAVASLDRSLDATNLPLRTVKVAPRKSDIAVGKLALLWQPWRRGADGFPTPAYDNQDA
ncbi:MAG: hypothetical protein RLZZ200_2316 [Pseudomonadota bacterium]|jgi:hypothetical protein